MAPASSGGRFAGALPPGDVIIGGGGANDDSFGEQCPLLHLFLTAVKDDDGKPRRTSTLMIFAEDGRFKAVLHERQHKLSLWREGETVKGCLDGLESALAGGKAEWRKDKQGRSG